MYSESSRGRSERSNASSCGLAALPVTVRLSSSFSIIAAISVTVACSRACKHALGFGEQFQRLPYAVTDGDIVGKLPDGGGRLLVAVAERQQRVQDVRRNGRRAMNVDRDRDIGAELVLELKQNAFRGLLPDAGNLREATGLLHGDRLRKLGNRQPGQHGERGPRADAVDFDELAKRTALVLAAEAIEQMRILAHDEMREQRDALAGRGQVVERSHRHVDLVRDALHVEQKLRRILLEKYSGQAADHGTGSRGA